MNAFFEGRESTSPYIEMIWRGHALRNYAPTCPADGRWNLLFLRQNGRVKVTVEGPLTKALHKTQAEGTEWLVIKFKLGTFMPRLPASNYLDADVILPPAATDSFWLNGSAWQFPNFENVETFVERLAGEGLLVSDPVVQTAMQDQPQDVSFRTLRRRFALATGLTKGSLRQIERAQQAAALLGQGVSILDAVDKAGYADQPHLTRSLKRFIGQTPAQIARVAAVE